MSTTRRSVRTKWCATPPFGIARVFLARSLAVRPCVSLYSPRLSGALRLPCGSPRISRLIAGVGVRNRCLTVLQRRRGRQARNLQDLLFVEGLPLQQGFGERVELLAVFGQESPGLVVALAYYPDHLDVYDAGGLLAEGLLSAVTTRSAQVGVLAGRELHHPNLLAHSPARDHPAGEVGGMLDADLSPGGSGA